MPGGMGGGATRSSGDDSCGALPLDKSFLRQLLQRPHRAEPTPLPPARSPGDRPPSFHFFPHTLVPPPQPPQPDQPPPVLALLAKDHVPSVRVPIPRGLPPGPWEPLEISPPLTAESQNSQDSVIRTWNASDQDATFGNNYRIDHRPQQQNVISANRTNEDRRDSGYRRRAERMTANSRAGYGNGVSCFNASFDRRLGDRRNAHGDRVEYRRMQNMNAVRYQYKKKHMNLGDYRHSIQWKPKTIEQRPPLQSAQKQMVKVEWVAVTKRKDEKKNLEEGDNGLQEVKDGDVLQIQTCNHCDKNECNPECNKLQIEESDVDEAVNGLLAEAFENGSSLEAEHEKQEDMEDFSSEGGASQEDALSDEQINFSRLKGNPQMNAESRSHTSLVEHVGSSSLRQQISSRRMRNSRRRIECRSDIEILTPGFLAVYKSLIPADNKNDRQNQLLQLLVKSINKEWPNAKLHLYGSCANSFGFSSSDIDICLVIDDSSMSKHDMLLKLADLLQSENFQDVEAITNARVPIVKMTDPQTGISCDICINNLLAVVNTKLLSDYAQIDDRLHQLAFIVKHWARSREVNETYRGTLSSYAYVLMCIHFLQLRKPAILPCLQEMEATYVLTVEGTECAYFDQVDKLQNFGVQNKESIAQLVWEFFQYWAYYHNYTSDVISIRTGTIISKQMKNWTRRVGNDRHLLCIEDPFEISHDLGRVVDMCSLKILREEFERAADILQYDPNPCVSLFEQL